LSHLAKSAVFRSQIFKLARHSIHGLKILCYFQLFHISLLS
jgi:hypothetical protein